jgi:alanine racemase
VSYFVSHIAKTLGANAKIVTDNSIDYIFFDSRKIYSPGTSLFIALKGPRRNGHNFIPELYKKGVRNFIICEEIKEDDFPGANILFVRDGLTALQQLAAFHRKQFDIPVIGITGSNGKTIVKEWLYQLLHENFNIVRSPKSYNSQIGVPFSVWEINKQHTLGIFEAGISQPGEMEKLNAIIQPTIGILTNIGEAHNEGFESMDQKVEEKIKLFNNAGLVIYSSDEWLVDKAIVLKYESVIRKTGKPPFKFFSWGKIQKADLQILEINKETTATEIIATYRNAETAIRIPFTDDASIQNAITCWCVMLHFGIRDTVIVKRMKQLQPVNMRLELKKGINHCTIINDSYSADLNSLHIALDFLKQMGGISKSTVILSDFFQTGMDDESLYERIADDLVQHKIDRVIGIGLNISKYLKFENETPVYSVKSEFYPSTEDFISRFRFSDFRDEVVLVKGARLFCFEQVIQLLELKVHQTELEINLNAVAHNLQQYQKLLEPFTKLMVMVKAFAYGSGGAEIANTLQYHKVDYLGVAYADEGTELRKAGITLPMMVMNAESETFETLVSNRLEPAIFSFSILKSLDGYLKREGIKNYPVHIEIETGMNRLGFAVQEMDKLCKEIKATSSFRVQSVFSHLAASEDPMQDEFTNKQYELFINACSVLEKGLGYNFLRHIANSAAILRHPQMQLNIVRLGIGLYGVDSASSGRLDLQPVATLKSTIAQIRNLKAGETVGYNRKGIVERDAIIATVSIGYADGFSRRLGNGAGKVWVKARRSDGQGQLAPVIGAVCMDMVMVDVTDIPGVKQGDEVIIFGKEISIQELANWAGTIPYEIMTGISERVKRVYYEE